MFHFFKKYSIGFAILFAFMALIVFKPFQSFKQTSQETLIVGLQSGYPPFEFMDSEGNIIGFDVDVANHIAQAIGKKLVIKDMEFEGEILSLKQGKIDLIISGMNITPSRLKEILMVPYHGETATSLSLIFWNKIPEGIQSIEDLTKLPDAIVSVESGAIPEAYMSHYPQIQAKSFQGALAPLMDVKYGKSIANLVEPDVADYLQNQHSEIKILNVPLPEGEKILGFGIGIKKENQQLFQQIQQVIDELKSSGKLQQLEEKWFKGD
jgi:arginine transport system substrate-binding protein